MSGRYTKKAGRWLDRKMVSGVKKAGTGLRQAPKKIAKKKPKKGAAKKSLKKRFTVTGDDPEPARGRSSGKRHASSAGGTTARQRQGAYPARPRQYSHKNPRIVAALRQILGQHKCDDHTAGQVCLRRRYATKRGDGWHITEDGRHYLKHGRTDDD